jgi:hypothetical protein
MPPFTYLTLLAFCFLAFALGVVEVALAHAVIKNFQEYAVGASVTWPPNYKSDEISGRRDTLFLLPADLRRGSTTASIVVGVLGIVCGLVGCWYTTTVIKRHGEYQVCQFLKLSSVASNNGAYREHQRGSSSSPSS